MRVPISSQTSYILHIVILAKIAACNVSDSRLLFSCAMLSTVRCPFQERGGEIVHGLSLNPQPLSFADLKAFLLISSEQQGGLTSYSFGVQ